MGVRGLDSFVREYVPGGCEKINIISEIEKFKRETGILKPTIVFDLNGLIHTLGVYEITIYGVRYNLHLSIMDRFFKELKQYNVNIVLFLDGRLQEEKVLTYCSRRDEDFMNYESALQNNYANELNAATLMLKTVEGYEPNVTFPTDPIVKYSSQSDLMNAVLYDGIINFDAILTDYAVSNNFINATINTFKRLAGILFKSKTANKRTFKMVTKISRTSNYSMDTLNSIVPNYTVPTLKELITENDDVAITAKKWNLLTWALSLNDVDEIQFREIADNYADFFVIILSIIYLLENEFITVHEADILLLTEYETRFYPDSMIEEKPKYNERGVRIAHMYNKTIFIVWDCLYICGLNKYITPCLFDGYQFQNMHQTYADLTVKIPLNEIEYLRIYKYFSLSEFVNLKI